MIELLRRKAPGLSINHIDALIKWPIAVSVKTKRAGESHREGRAAGRRLAGCAVENARVAAARAAPVAIAGGGGWAGGRGSRRRCPTIWMHHPGRLGRRHRVAGVLSGHYCGGPQLEIPSHNARGRQRPDGAVD